MNYSDLKGLRPAPYSFFASARIGALRAMKMQTITSVTAIHIVGVITSPTSRPDHTMLKNACSN